jgi:hypothetical protein
VTLGLVAEFASADDLLRAIRHMRGDGYALLDAYTPYPVDGLDEALGLRRSFLGWLVFGLGLFGAGFAFFVQWLANERLFPLNIGGRPPLAIPAFVIICFETMVLFAGAGAFVALFWACRLPQLAHPLFGVEGFASASRDRFWLGVNASDARFDPDGTDAALRALGASRVQIARGAA